MSEWENLLNNYLIRYSNEIQKVTRPLHDYLGVGYFSYHKIDLNGRCVPILDLPNWAETFIDEKIYTFDPLIGDYRSCKSGYYLLNHFGSKDYINKIDELGGKLFNVHQNFIIFEKTDSSVEFFDFYGKPNSTNFQHVYMNHLPLLKKFTTHFKKELNSIIHEMEENGFFFADLKKGPFQTEQYTPLEYDKFLKSIGLQDLLKISSTLSPREKELLRLLLKGFSAKETASTLKLSPRTIESYFETIKHKFKCWGKNNLFPLAKELDELSLL